jgi:PAS domain S-box-containing protein
MHLMLFVLVFFAATSIILLVLLLKQKREFRIKLVYQLARERKFKNITENMIDLLCQIDINGIIKYASPSHKKLLGYAPIELVGQSIFTFIHPDEKDTIKLHYSNIIKTRICERIEFRYLCKNGDYTWLETSCNIITDKSGKASSAVLGCRDISGRKLSEQILWKQAQLQSNLLSSIPALVYLKDLNLKYIEVNERMTNLLGKTKSEIFGKTDFEVFSKNVAELQYKTDKEILNTKKPLYNIEMMVQSPDGKALWLSTSKLPYYNSNGEMIGLAGVCIDITEKKQSERTIIETEERYKTLVDFSPNPIFLLTGGKFSFINSAAIELLKLKQNSNLKKLNPLDFIYPDDRSILMNSLEQISGNKPSTTTSLRVIRTNGEILYILATAIYVDFNGETSILVVCQDISNQKQIEIELADAKAKAEMSDKLKSAFLANMSHELRTPLNGIIGFAGLLLKPNLSAEKLKRYSQIINSNSHNLLALINDIIDISKIESGQLTVNKEPLQLNGLLKETYDIFSELASRKGLKLVLSKKLQDNEVCIISDELKIKQILNNLLYNALKFTYEGTIDFGYKIKTNYIEFYVKDSGIGIAKEFQELVFERFKQVDSIDKTIGGTGLGLSICKALVELMNGEIWLESEVSKGTTFYFTIPYKPVKKTLKKTVNSKRKFDWTEKTILIADDESTNQYYIQELLSETGAKVLVAEDGLQAINLFKDHQETSLILLDIKMPEMNGFEVLKAIKKINSNIKVIANSAYALTNEKLDAMNAGFDDFITKPIDQKEFFSKIKKYI